MLNFSHFPISIKTFGYSMFPVLKDGDIVYQRKINFSKIKVNDIICIKKWGKVFTHRVIYKKENYLIAKGDRNQFSDGKIYPKNIIGIVYKIKRGEQIFGIDDLYLFQSTLYFQEIVKIKKTLKRQKIKYVLLKGLPLHLYFESSHPKRFYADCDILIDKKDFQKVESILEKAKYKSEVLTTVTGDELDNKAEISFKKVLNGVPIYFDIHLEIVFMMTKVKNSNLLYPRELLQKLNQKFMNERILINVRNEDFFILNKENLIIYLFLHLFHHNFEGTYRYELVGKILSTSKIDYKIIENTINEFLLQKFIYPCLILMKRFYGISTSRELIALINLKISEKLQIENRINTVNIFEVSNRIEEGQKRFSNLVFFSPSPYYQKIFILFDPKILKTILWVITKKITFTLNDTKKSISIIK